ncbi:MAG: hypothetical protein EP348_01485 [Alphaproteobacteria bacterium]|nr:MAG: hypothetical protein EP348_01485 [Alphaproteobacteria bacterium]
MPPGSAIEETGPPPIEYIRKGIVRDDRWLYGRLLFHSPSLLGEKAVRIALSCNSCHPNGHVNKDFYIEGLSDGPGRIDLSHHFWQAGQEDGKSNPLDIPSLRGVGHTAPYGSVKSFPSLPAFTRHVIIDEFAGPIPAHEDMMALMAYLRSLDFKGSANDAADVSTSPDMRYLSLLEAPLAAKDLAVLDNLVDLIRGDIGRNQKKASPKAIRLVTGLLTIREQARRGNFETARAEYRRLTQ